ncbi:GtrA family protein [Enterococcus sp. BWT-B8]|uniref:GtrA family protein n=1 Tax=unclassified Enterococcus TaxID=2608891 RepID=UPI001E37EA0B|nr:MULTISPECIES: GtrA family protein [unclassified Enterococcus]MCB5953237.1 GtrA family protein [Enterococcus sp. BWT-B8]MCB5956215.1 GtrA family protein [Enterococcus sp. CWB-B31]
MLATVKSEWQAEIIMQLFLEAYIFCLLFTVFLKSSFRKDITKFMLNKIIGFGIVGIIATVIDFASLFILRSVLGVDVYIAATIAFILALIFNYVASMKYVFVAKEGLSVQKQVVIFFVTAVIGWMINQAMMYVGIEWLGIYYMLAKFLATTVTMIFNFVSRHILLER